MLAAAKTLVRRAGHAALAVMLGTTLVTASQKSVLSDNAQTPDIRLVGTTLEASGTTFDFGHALTSSPVIEHIFVLHASDGRAVAFDRVQAGCGCTSAVVDSQAGGSGAIAIRVAIDPSHLSSGHTSKSVLVYIKGQAAPAATLEMTGTVESGIDAKPDRVDFGVVPAGVSRECVLDVTLARELTAASLDLVSNAPGVTISSLPDDVGGVRRYKATLAQSAAIGEVQGAIAIRCHRPDASAAIVSTSIPVTGRVQGGISVSPAIVVFGAVSHGKRVVRSITFTADTMEALKGIRLTSDNGDVSARLVKPYNYDSRVCTAQLEVAVDTSASAGAIAAHITVATAFGQHIVVPVYADVVPV